MHENEITGTVVDAAFQVHTRLGPGLFESVYRAALEYKPKRRGLRVGLLINVDVALIKDGIVRMVKKLE